MASVNRTNNVGQCIKPPSKAIQIFKYPTVYLEPRACGIVFSMLRWTKAFADFAWFCFLFDFSFQTPYPYVCFDFPSHCKMFAFFVYVIIACKFCEYVHFLLFQYSPRIQFAYTYPSYIDLPSPLPTVSFLVCFSVNRARLERIWCAQSHNFSEQFLYCFSSHYEFSFPIESCVTSNWITIIPTTSYRFESKLHSEIEYVAISFLFYMSCAIFMWFFFVVWFLRLTLNGKDCRQNSPMCPQNHYNCRLAQLSHCRHTSSIHWIRN